MQNSKHLLKLAKIFEIKYASTDANDFKDKIQQMIQTAVGNASTQPGNHIMPFLKMLDMDNASLSLTVSRNGTQINVSQTVTNPAELNSKYSLLSEQVQNYLSRNLELFPSEIYGQRIDYNNFVMNLIYPTDLTANR